MVSERGIIMNCFYCGKKKRGANQFFYKLDQDGHIICQSCLSAGYWKSALEIIEHNKQEQFICGKRLDLSVLDDYCRVPQEIIEEIVDEICNKNKE